MKRRNWGSLLDQIDEEYVLEALESYAPAGKSGSLPRRVLFLAAAIATIFMLGLTAYAENWFGIRDMRMELFGKTYITIAGYQNSNEYKALQEWESVRPETQRVKGPVEEDKIYSQYGAFAPGAKKSLDAILEKYALQPYDRWASVYDGDPQSLYDAVGAEGFLPESCAAYRGTTDPNIPGCSVRNGISIFSYSDATLLPDGTRVNYEFVNCAKGYIPIFMGFALDPGDITEWYYTAADGTQVLLCTDTDSSILLADLPNSFLSISVAADTDSDTVIPLSKEDLEAFADLFGYQIIAGIG